MRKLLFLFIAVFAFSCSSDDGGSPVNSKCDNVFEGIVTLTSQAEVDEFAAYGYCEINGSLRIGYYPREEYDIFDLSGLASLKKITAGLHISLTRVVNLHGLENLESVGPLTISHNKELETLEHLTSLKEVAYYNKATGIDIGWNPKLKNLKGLEKIETLESISIVNNSILKNLEGLEGLRTLEGLYIRDCLELATLEGLSNITDMGVLTLMNNPSFISLKSLTNLKTMVSLQAMYNDELTSLDGLEQITKMDYLGLGWNSKLSSLQGLQHVTRLNFISLVENPLMTSLQGLENLKTVSGLYLGGMRNLASISKLSGVTSFVDIGNPDHTYDIRFVKGIWFNDVGITSLSGLQNITSFKDEIEIYNSANLTDFCAINNIVPSATYFMTQNNAYNPTVADILAGNCSQ